VLEHASVVPGDEDRHNPEPQGVQGLDEANFMPAGLLKEQ